MKFSHSTQFEISLVDVSITPQTLRNCLSHQKQEWSTAGFHKIAKIEKCNSKTVTRWINRWKETKDLSNRSRPGALRTTTTEQDQMMVDMALAKIDATSKTIQQDHPARTSEQQSM